MSNQNEKHMFIIDVDKKTMETLKVFADRINTDQKNIFMSVRNIGGHLLDAKMLLQNKSLFEKWVENTFTFRIRTAYNMINSFLLIKDYPMLESLGKDSLYYLASGKFPKELIVLLNDTKTNCMNLKKKDLVLIKEQFEKGKVDHLSDFIKTFYKSSRQKHYSAEWLKKGLKFVTDVRSNLKALDDAMETQKHFVGAELVATEVYDKIADQIIPALAALEAYLQQQSASLEKQKKEEEVANLTQEIVDNQTCAVKLEDKQTTETANTSQLIDDDTTGGDDHLDDEYKLDDDTNDQINDMSCETSNDEQSVPVADKGLSERQPEHLTKEAPVTETDEPVAAPSTLLHEYNGENEDEADEEEQSSAEDVEQSKSDTITTEEENNLSIAA